MSVGGASFDYVVPTNKWVHLALVARERKPTATASLCPKALYDGDVSVPRSVVELFADGRLVGWASELTRARGRGRKGGAAMAARGEGICSVRRPLILAVNGTSKLR